MNELLVAMRNVASQVHGRADVEILSRQLKAACRDEYSGNSDAMDLVCAVLLQTRFGKRADRFVSDACACLEN